MESWKSVSFHDMFVHQSGLRRVKGTQNKALTLQDPLGLNDDADVASGTQ
jgi:hypothetical protein